MANNNHLLIDMGGTHTRLKIAGASDATKLLNTKFSNPKALFNDYKKRVCLEKFGKVFFAIPGDPDQDPFQFINLSWSFSRDDVSKWLPCDELKVINDFTALSCCVPYIKKEHYTEISKGNLVRKPTDVEVVIGPGTGLGSSVIHYRDGKAIVLYSEFGQFPLSKAGTFEQELSGPAIAQFLRSRYDIEGGDSEVFAYCMNFHEQELQIVLKKHAEKLAQFCQGIVLANGRCSSLYFAGGVLSKLRKLYPFDFFLEKLKSHSTKSRIFEDMSVKLVSDDINPAILGLDCLLQHGESISLPH